MKIRYVLALTSVVLTSLTHSLRADVVTDWNSAALNAIRIDKTPPPKSSRALAILHVAIYDAVNGITRTHQPYLVGGHVPASASVEAAAAAAAHKVLVSLYPGQQAAFDTRYQNSLAAVADGPQKRSAVGWGEFVAVSILAVRATDGFDATVAAPSGSGPGVWLPTPPAFASYLLPQWAFVRPFCMTSSTQFRPSGPPALSSAKYADEFNEVKQLGAATNSLRTADQTQIALFWADGAGTETPPGHWNSIAQDISAVKGNTLEENARLFALLNMAMADAAICAWDGKYVFNFWRPVTAIRNADSDGNAATAADPGWSSMLVTPPFPDYVSGHSTFSAAAATVLAIYYGTDNIPFTTGSDFLPGVYRSFNSFSAAAAEAGFSRVYGGIHFRSASEDGLHGGLSIGQYVMEHFLLPKGNRSRLAERGL